MMPRNDLGAQCKPGHRQTFVRTAASPTPKLLAGVPLGGTRVRCIKYQQLTPLRGRQRANDNVTLVWKRKTAQVTSRRMQTRISQTSVRRVR